MVRYGYMVLLEGDLDNNVLKVMDFGVELRRGNT